MPNPWRSVELFLRYGNFMVFKMATIHNLGFVARVCLGHPRRVFSGVCHYAKFGCNRAHVLSVTGMYIVFITSHMQKDQRWLSLSIVSTLYLSTLTALLAVEYYGALAGLLYDLKFAANVSVAKAKALRILLFTVRRFHIVLKACRRRWLSPVSRQTALGDLVNLVQQ